MKNSTRARVAAAVSLALVTPAMEARADSKQECAAAYEKTQTLRDEGKLLDARSQALACSASTCSVYVVKDCAQWLSDIEASMPTVLVTAEDAAGFETLAVSVTVDGQLLARTLGKALSMDPGEHVLRFEADGTEAIEQKVSLRPGEKNRKLAISFKKPPPAGPPLIVPAAPTAPLPSAAPRSATQLPDEPVAAPGPERAGRRVPVWAWVSGGAGVVAAGVGVGFGVSGLNANSAVIARCGGNAAKCPGHLALAAMTLANQRTLDRNVVIGLGAAAVVGLGVGVIGIATAGSNASRPRTSAVLAPFGSPSGGGVALQGQF